MGLDYLILSFVAFLTCGILSIAGKCTNGQVLQAVQCAHVRPTSRLGGVGVFFALGVSVFFAPVEASLAYCKFLFAASILFLAGLAEDLGFGVSPVKRLLAAFSASLIVIILFDVWVPRADILGLKIDLSHWLVGIPLTLLVTAGIANGFNIIDGVNGLSALNGIVAAIALALIARRAGYEDMSHLATMFGACVVGFALWNYPFGRIFLGDAGAYTLGFVLSWFAIGILLKVPTASPWAMLLVLFWPVADTLLSIWRRKYRAAPTMAPDRLHFHQLVMRALEIHLLGRRRRHIANPLTTFVLTPFVMSPPVVGVLLWDNTTGAFLAVLAFSGAFVGSYSLAFAILRRLPRPTSKKRENSLRTEPGTTGVAPRLQDVQRT